MRRAVLDQLVLCCGNRPIRPMGAPPAPDTSSLRSAPLRCPRRPAAPRITPLPSAGLRAVVKKRREFSWIEVVALGTISNACFAVLLFVLAYTLAMVMPGQQPTVPERVLFMEEE